LNAECSAVDFAKKNLAYDAGFEPAPGTYTVKFPTSENLTGKMRAFESKLITLDFAAEKSWLPISSVVLRNQMAAQNVALATGAQDKKATADHALIQDGKKMVPRVTRALRSGRALNAVLEAFESEARDRCRRRCRSIACRRAAFPSSCGSNQPLSP